MNIRSHLSLINSRIALARILSRDKSSSLKFTYFSNSILESSKPIFLSRLGFTESRVIGSVLDCYDPNVENDAALYSGVYPGSPLTSLALANEHLTALASVNILGLWPVPYLNLSLSFSRYAGLFVPVDDLIPINTVVNQNFFYPVLKCKRVLVITPFADTVAYNYHNKLKIPFLNQYLPDFGDLQIIRSPYGSFSCRSTDHSLLLSGSWLENLSKLKSSIAESTFDIAILGCGAYGLPLGCYIKNTLNKSVLHLGGSLQLLFGIRGRRWCNEARYKHLFHIVSSWSTPLRSDLPKNPQLVENGCYF